jgi:hypothetical protein
VGPIVGLDAVEMRKIPVPDGNRTQAVKSVARRYTDSCPGLLLKYKTIYLDYYIEECGILGCSAV